MANSSHKMKRLESRKSHSWWWDSHISPKNSKWLAENLEEMDQSVKRMLKLIEEDGDSFAKKAEMYYQKRPELVAHVEEFYRMYRSLAERYDNLTGELRKNIPSDLHSQGSGISDCSSELSSPLPTPEKRPSRRRSSNRAAGFDFFLGSGGGSSDFSRKESYTMSSSSSGSESESDGASSRNNFLSSPVNGNGEGLHQRIIELEAEVCEVKEKLRVAEENSEALAAVAGNGNHEDIVGTNTWYDEELKVASEKLRLSEEEILRLKAELNLEHGNVLELQEQIAEKEAIFPVSDDKIKALEKELVAMRSKLETSEEEAEKLRLLIKKNESSEGNFDSQADPLSSSSFSENREIQINLRNNQVDGLETRITDQEQRVKALEEELEIRNDQLQLLEEEIGRLNLELEKNKTFVANTDNLKVWLESCEKEVESKKVELDLERKRILDLQEQIRRFEIIVLDRDNEIMKVKVAISEAEENFTLEKSQLHEKIFFISDSQAHLEGKLKEWELKVRSLEEEIKCIEAEKLKIQDAQVARETVIQSEIKQLRADITEKGNHVEVLNKSLDALKLKFDMLVAEKDQLNAKVHTLTEEVCSRDDIVHQKDEHLHRLHMEHVDLIAGSEGHHKLVRELKTRVETLEEEVERQQTVISEGAEEKREAIRQLCFSLEHYRNGYHELRQAFLVHKRPTVLAS